MSTTTTTVTHPDGTSITTVTTSPAPIEFFDPHFHIWDIREGGTHDAKELFAPDGAELYVAEQLEKHLVVGPRFKHVGGVFVEAVSVCFVDTPAAELQSKCVAEAQFAASELAKSKLDYLVCGTACLEDDTAAVEATLAKLAAIPNLRGIRQIVNHEPSWPRNKKEAVGNLLVNEAFVKNFGLLAKYNMSFDLQLNHHQFKTAAALVAAHPDVNIIINHLGSPTLADLTEPERAAVYWDGMAALAAAHDNVFIKLSMLCYTAPKWDECKPACDAVLRLIKLFGADRCFFASNFPVDLLEDLGGWTARGLLEAFQKLVADAGYDRAAQEKLFAGNAKRAYRF